MVAAVSIVGAVALAPSAQAAATTVGLGTADPFAVLAGQGITNTGPTTVNGDIGSSPNQSITGRASVTIVNGSANPGTTAGAKDDLTTAYNNAAGQTPPTKNISADLGGRTLVGGIYKSGSSLGLTGALTLDGKNNPNSVFIFQAGSTLTTASASSVVLTNGAQACNVFWQIGSSATLGTRTTFVGNILALQSIAVQTGSTIQGRALARNGSVTLDTNRITRARCSTPTASPTPSPTSSPTGTATSTSTTSPTGTTTSPTGTATPSGTATPTGTAKPTGTATPSGQVSRTPVGAPGTGSDTGDGGPPIGAAGLGVGILLLGGLTVGGVLTARRRGARH